MALKRATAPLVTSAIRSSQPSIQTTPSICLRCLTNSYHRQRRAVPRRTFASITEHRPNELPHDLEPKAPPRNTGIPDTSIAGGKPKVDDTRSVADQRSEPQPPGEQDRPNISIDAEEAQHPQPTSQKSAVGSVASADPTPSSSTRPQRKSKLRPRKAAMTLSPAAVTALKQLLEQPEPKMIRVGVKNRGCSGLAYHLEYVEKPGSFDEAVEQEGVKVLVDSKALFSIIGSEMDWIEDKLSRRFVFKNPNITEQCGCGESFSIS